jgi:DNA-binding XRE family transcriptional regulator
MDSKEISYFRRKLNKTQKQMAQLLGTSVKSIQGYEQGWRKVPVHVERQIFFLVTRKRGNKTLKPCWVVKKCAPEVRKKCPAWEFRAGTLCWFINGTICEGAAQKDWRKKMQICRTCEVLNGVL